MQEEQEWISCDTNPLKCGMPTIEIFGGGGDGAYATAVVDQLGSEAEFNELNVIDVVLLVNLIIDYNHGFGLLYLSLIL